MFQQDHKPNMMWKDIMFIRNMSDLKPGTEASTKKPKAWRVGWPRRVGNDFLELFLWNWG